MSVNTISLVSNSSMMYHPNNTTSSFTCQFQEELDYSDGEYEVALVSFLYPKTYYSFRVDEEYYFELFFNHESYGENEIVSNPTSTMVHLTKIILPPGCYTDGEHIQTEMNNKLKTAGFGEMFRFSYDSILRKFSVEFLAQDNKWYCVKFSKDLGRKIGIYSEKEDFSTVVGRGGTIHLAEFTIRVDEIDQLFVSCDLVQSSHLVGDKKVPVLHIVPGYNGKFGDNVIFEPKWLVWLPLKRKSFHTAECYISDAQGRNIPFTSGVSVVRLMTRKKGILS